MFAKSRQEFWNSKDPSQWSDKEVEQLLNHSPWAKQVDAEMPYSGPTGMPSGGGMGRGAGGGGEGGMG